MTYPDPFSTATFELRRAMIPRFEQGKGIIYLVTESEDGEEIVQPLNALAARRMMRELDVAINNL